MTVHRDIGQLSDREKQILRLLAHGHDAKSAARMLDVSIHTVNERLRDARRKLGVSSSREAARLLLSAEGYEEQISGNEEMGFVTPTVGRVEQALPTLQVGKRLPLVTGAVLMVLTALIAVGAYALGRHAAVEQTTGAPRVVATTPEPGAAIAPGPFVLSVTFDQAMQDQSFSFVQDLPRTFPKRLPMACTAFHGSPDLFGAMRRRAPGAVSRMVQSPALYELPIGEWRSCGTARASVPGAVAIAGRGAAAQAPARSS